MLVVLLVLGLSGCRKTGSADQGASPAATVLPTGPVRHLVWITFDALRADHLTLYGYPIQTAPQLDKWAKQAIIFDRCISQGSGTLLSVPPLLFGVNCTSPGKCPPRSVDARPSRSLPFLLRELGYEVSFWSNHGAFPHLEHLPDPHDRAEATENEIAAEALAWQLAHAGQKTFLWLHFLAPHQPQSIYWEPVKAFAAARKDLPDHLRHIPEGTPKEKVGDVEYRWASYDAAITKSDQALGLFLQGIKAAGLLQDSLVVVSADHGEEMYFDASDKNAAPDLDHGRWTHRSLVHVPLILLAPLRPQDAGRRIATTVRHIDIAPTFAESAGLDLKQGAYEGVSLWRVLSGELKNNLPAFSEGCTRDFPCSRSLERDDWVLWRLENGQETTYKLFALDPIGQSRLVDGRDDSEMFLSMQKELDAVVARNPTFADWTDMLPSEDEIKRLKALGYLK